MTEPERLQPYRVIVVTRGGRTAEVLRNQLDHLLGEFIRFEYLSLEQGIHFTLHADLVVVSSIFVLELIARSILPGTHTLVVRRTLSPEGWERVRALPEGTRALVVNDTQNSTVETIALLWELGLKQVELFPCFPGVASFPDVDVVITPNERALVPQTSAQVINIGDRVLDPVTIFEILSQLDLFSQETSRVILHQVKHSLPRGKSIFRLLTPAIKDSQTFFSLFDAVHDGILLVNRQGEVVSANQRAQSLFRKDRGGLLGSSFIDILSRCNAKTLQAGSTPQELVSLYGRQYSITRHFFDQLVSEGGLDGFIVLHEELSLPPVGGRPAAVKAQARYSFEQIIGSSPALEAARQKARQFALRESPVLIEGESGTGKELFAHGIHAASPRRNAPFIAFNCAAIPDALIESELFGHEGGAFTGALRQGRPGLFEMADGGTLFLDEIGDISPRMQSRLLRAIQEQEVLRVGGTTVCRINVRLIAATNRPLAEMVKNGTFRSDLYYRLNVLLLRVPSLRQRKHDIPLLLQHFLARQGLRKNIPRTTMDRLQAYDWPGNIRELENCVEYMSSFGPEARLLPEELPEALQRQEERPLQASFELSEGLEPGLLAVLQAIAELNARGHRPGRVALTAYLSARKMLLTEGEIRSRLKQLEQCGAVVCGKGRSGSLVLPEGIRLLQKKEEPFFRKKE